MEGAEAPRVALRVADHVGGPPLGRLLHERAALRRDRAPGRTVRAGRRRGPRRLHARGRALVAASDRAGAGLPLSAAHGVVTLSWAAPSELGGSPITSYLVVARADHEIPVTCIAITQSCALHGIVHGHTYKVDVTATNAADRSGPTARRTVPL